MSVTFLDDTKFDPSFEAVPARSFPCKGTFKILDLFLNYVIYFKIISCSFFYIGKNY